MSNYLETVTSVQHPEKFEFGQRLNVSWLRSSLFWMFTFQTLLLSGKSLKTYSGIIVLLLLSSSWVSATHFLKVPG